MENLQEIVCDSISLKLIYPQEAKNPEEIISASEISSSERNQTRFS